MTQLRPGPSNALPNELSRRIAQEIYDRILENYSTSRVVLFKCSIVCRAWLQTCRYHLFAVVTFRADLLEFISSSHVADSIVPFIRTVIVKGTRIKTQIEAEQAISLLLALENLSQLRLQSCDWGNLGFSTTWPSYDALFDRLTHFHLQSVHFYSPFALISVVRHMHMLQHLTLDNITWDRDGLHSEHSLASHSRCWPGLLPIPIHLTTLNIAFSLSSPILSWLLSQTAHALSLQTVILSDIQPREISLVGQFLRTVGLNLTQLELGFVLHNHNATITQGECDISVVFPMHCLTSRFRDRCAQFDRSFLQHKSVQSCHPSSRALSTPFSHSNPIGCIFLELAIFLALDLILYSPLPQSNANYRSHVVQRRNAARSD